MWQEMIFFFILAKAIIGMPAPQTWAS